MKTFGDSRLYNEESRIHMHDNRGILQGGPFHTLFIDQSIRAGKIYDTHLRLIEDLNRTVKADEQSLE
jgi:hypothetical protein